MVYQVRAFDKTTNEFVGFQRAANKTEATRYSHDYQCPNKVCSCTYHWRKAVGAHENTERRPAVFVKNRISSHVPSCQYDYPAFAQRHEQVDYDGDMLNFRIQFPLGTDRQDTHPQYLSKQQKSQARLSASKKGFSSLKALVDFIESEKGGLTNMSMQEVNLLYQGQKYPWDHLFVDTRHYSCLLAKANKTPALTIVKPIRHTGVSANGKHKFSCAAQRVESDGKSRLVRPMLLLDDEDMVGHFTKVAKIDACVLVAARLWQGSGQRYQDHHVFMHVSLTAQLSRVDTAKYWQASC